MVSCYQPGIFDDDDDDDDDGVCAPQIGMEAVNNPKALVFRPDQHLQQQLHQ
jgi:hypothetical protein